MSTVQATSATAVQDLAKSLIKSFDANSDGQLGSDEFGSFLSQLMSGIQTASGTLAASTATAGAQPLTKGTLRRDLFEDQPVRETHRHAQDDHEAADQRGALHRDPGHVLADAQAAENPALH